MTSTFIPPNVLPHFEAVCDWMKSLPAEGAEEVGDFFKWLGDDRAGSKRDLAKARALLASEDLERAFAQNYITSIRRCFWAVGIEPTDHRVGLALLVRERYLSDSVHSLS